jgi:transposase
MDWWLEIRQLVLRQGVSKRQVLRETGLHWSTLEKILAHSSPPGYRRSQPAVKPKIGPWLGRIVQMLDEDHGKQYHPAKRIFERLRAEGFIGGYTIVKEAVRELTRYRQEVFLPLSQRPGEAQVDFGQAGVKMAGVRRKVVFFVMTLCHSDAFFVMAFDRECTEAFWEGHVRAFAFFGGVPRRITIDNSKITVAQILGSHARRITEGFRPLVRHYLFDYHFCRVRRAHEKGVVEGIVKYTRLNFLVPVPEGRDFQELNAYLLAGCRRDLERRLWGKPYTKAPLLKEDQAVFHPLPAAPLAACRIEKAAADSEALVRFDTNDYSVPVEYAYQPVVVKGYLDRVEVCHREELVAVHPRCWAREQQFFNPVHYLPRLERKPHSLEHARPFEGWALPDCFSVLQRRLEAQGPAGRREYIRVLRRLEKHDVASLVGAIEKALALGLAHADAVIQLVLGPQAWDRMTFSLAGREHLRWVTVATTDVRAYQALWGPGGEA